MKATVKRIKKRTAEIEVGHTYFLSSFYDKSGAVVKVLDKSTKINSAGWPSSVLVEVVEPINETGTYYAIGSKRTVNATNLYEHREQASAAVKYGCASQVQAVRDFLKTGVLP